MTDQQQALTREQIERFRIWLPIATAADKLQVNTLCDMALRYIAPATSSEDAEKLAFQIMDELTKCLGNLGRDANNAELPHQVIQRHLVNLYLTKAMKK